MREFTLKRFNAAKQFIKNGMRLREAAKKAEINECYLLELLNKYDPKFRKDYLG